MRELSPATDGWESRGPSAKLDVVVVGPGPRFLSGIAYHTAAVARAFLERGDASGAMLVRQLCPTALYPGREHVGKHDAGILNLDGVAVHEGMDWYWGRSIRPAIQFLRWRRPQVVLFQWWTSATAHTYLALASVARRSGSKVVFEMHEISDPSETTIPFLRHYSSGFMRMVASRVDGLVLHSASDEAVVTRHYPALAARPKTVVFPGPLEHGGGVQPVPARTRRLGEPIRLLFFGLLRAYKGIDELVAAFAALVTSGYDVHLTVAGEAWNDDADSALACLRSLPADRLDIRPGYVPDDEVRELFVEADVVVLPYRRAVAAGPVNLTMATGLPLVTTTVPALVEACHHYHGVEFAAPNDAHSLEAAVIRALARVGERYDNPHSWRQNAERYATLFEEIGAWNGRYRERGWL